MSGQIDKLSDSSKHDGDITCLQFVNDHLYSSGSDGKIKIWDKDLNLKSEISAHNAHIYTIVLDSTGKIYSASNESAIKVFPDPLSSGEGNEIVQSTDEIAALTTDGEILYSGDDKGVVIMWVNGQIKLKYNLVEEVRSLAVRKELLYTVCDKDVVITSLTDSVAADSTGRYTTRATLVGRAPLRLIGPEINDHRKYLVFVTRDGKGLTLVNNSISEHFSVAWTCDNIHEMIINAVDGSDNVLFTGGWDGKVKKLVDIGASKPKVVGEVDVNSCVNSICRGDSDSILYVGCTDGVIRKVRFGN